MITRLAGIVFSLAFMTAVAQAEELVIAGSPGLKRPLESLAEAFEAAHPGVSVRLYLDDGIGLRQTIAAAENSLSGQYFFGASPVHVIAPGGDELITRLEEKHYVLPGTRKLYAAEQLVLVVPVQLVEAPASFEEIGRTVTRLAVADPDRTVLGQQTGLLLRALGVGVQLDVATDAGGVLDHLLSGQAEAGVLFGHDAVRERDRVRIVARAESGYSPTLHSMAMERNCPNRELCGEFLAFIQSAGARRILRSLGYAVPAPR